MADPVLIDNDIILKLCCFGCHDALASSLGESQATMLSIGRFTLRDRIKRTRSIGNRERVAAALEEAFAALQIVQANSAEVELATEFEEQAVRLSLDLDSGESQLLAILIQRAWPLLITGDKRAIIAIHHLHIGGVDGRLACLEQLIGTLLTSCGVGHLRQGVCAEPAADTAITMCFACSAQAIDESSVRAGLASYVEHLRRASGAVLVKSAHLSGSV